MTGRPDPEDYGPDDDDEEGPAASRRTPPPPPRRGGGGLTSSAKGAAASLGKTGPGRQGRAIAHDAGNIVIGLVAYAIGINFLRYGPAGVKAYFAAKLTNRPSQPGNGTPADLNQTGPIDYLFRGARNAANGQATATAAAPPTTEAPAPSNAGRTVYA